MYKYECKVRIKLRDDNIEDCKYIVTTHKDSPFKVEKLNENTIEYPAKFMINEKEVIFNKDDIKELKIYETTMLGM